MLPGLNLVPIIERQQRFWQANQQLIGEKPGNLA